MRDTGQSLGPLVTRRLGLALGLGLAAAAVCVLLVLGTEDATSHLRTRDRGCFGLQETRAARYWTHCVSQHKGVTMSHRKETALDVAEYTFGGPLFFVVAGATAAVMAVGFAVITLIDRVLH